MKYNDHIHSGRGRFRMQDEKIATEYTYISTPGLESLLLLYENNEVAFIVKDAKFQYHYMLAHKLQPA